MKKINVDLIDLHLSTEDEASIGTLRVTLPPRGEVFVASTELSRNLTSEELKDLKRQVVEMLASFRNGLEVEDADVPVSKIKS